MAGGLALLIGKLKKGPADEEKDEKMDAPDEEESSSVAKDYAREAYKALKDDDEDAFVEALMGLHACSEEE